VNMKAVIPAAGLGTRFLPLTKGQPKEMLPIVDKPTIQYVVEEAIAAGIHDIIMITGRDKRAIEDHFDHSFELESLLQRQNRMAELRELERISDLADIHYIRQKSPIGLGDAIYRARKHVGDEPFAVMLGDTIYRSQVPVVKQLMQVHERVQSSVIAVDKVPWNKVDRYGIVEGRQEEGLYLIKNLVEKPPVGSAPSNYAIAGTYILTPAIFECIERTEPGVNGEIQLTDALDLLLKKEKIFGCKIIGKRYDIGDKINWMETNIAFALEDPRFSRELKRFLRQKLKNVGKKG
jgi:UTP--glucose-1-phosphate uridylyltransferase